MAVPRPTRRRPNDDSSNYEGVNTSDATTTTTSSSNNITTTITLNNLQLLLTPYINWMRRLSLIVLRRAKQADSLEWSLVALCFTLLIAVGHRSSSSSSSVQQQQYTVSQDSAASSFASSSSISTAVPTATAPLVTVSATPPPSPAPTLAATTDVPTTSSFPPTTTTASTTDATTTINTTTNTNDDNDNNSTLSASNVTGMMINETLAVSSSNSTSDAAVSSPNTTTTTNDSTAATATEGDTTTIAAETETTSTTAPLSKESSSATSSSEADHTDHVTEYNTSWVERHPHCFSDDILDVDPNTGRRFLNVEAVGQYLARPSNRLPRYDHMSCMVMTPRYNCAGATVDASRFQLILRREKDNICDLNQLMDDIGGPVGLSQQLQSQQQQKKEEGTSSSSSSPPAPFTFIFQGNSYLRQAWESLTCSWANQISNILLQVNGPDVSGESFEKRNHSMIQIKEWGLLVHKVPKGCHGKKKGLEHYYRVDDGIPIPPVGPDNCNDNLAMVEFGNSIRFYNLLHMEYYAQTKAIYERVGLLDPESITAYIGQDPVQFAKTIQSVRTRLNPTMLREKSLSIPNYDVFQTLQRRDILPILQQEGADLFADDENDEKGGEGDDKTTATTTTTAKEMWWFGADNPGLTKVPDDTSCMPGPVDDMVNLILFCFLRGIQIQAGEGQPIHLVD